MPEFARDREARRQAGEEVPRDGPLGGAVDIGAGRAGAEPVPGVEHAAADRPGVVDAHDTLPAISRKSVFFGVKKGGAKNTVPFGSA